ncbi:MAG: NADPH-dependent reductase [Caulobacteraceae bacterium]|nr:NADPH-dependent reductase [Caulobacteraceae bacterium]
MSPSPASQPYIVAIGGALRVNSSTEKALRVVLGHAEALGARTRLFSGPDLDLPLYNPECADRTPRAVELLAALAQADGVILGSPGYHGGVSGLVKNVLDYVEDLRGDARCYLENRAVGCVGAGGGWQGATAALSSLRTIVHALRGWNTPLGVAINTAEPVFDGDGACLDPRLADQLKAMAAQVVDFARRARPIPLAAPLPLAESAPKLRVAAG